MFLSDMKPGNVMECTIEEPCAWDSKRDVTRTRSVTKILVHHRQLVAKDGSDSKVECWWADRSLAPDESIRELVLPNTTQVKHMKASILKDWQIERLPEEAIRLIYDVK